MAIALVLGTAPAQAWQPTGTQTVTLNTREGGAVALGTVDFQTLPDGRTGFTMHVAHERMKDYFLSMKEFKCLDGPSEIMCHVRYPYPQPGTLGGTAAAPDFAWLEHTLLFMFKTPQEFGAKLWNGLYFKFKATDQGLIGTPQSIYLNRISAPPDQPDKPPFGPLQRDDVAPGSRWITGITIR